jgi:hypothetical protein
LKLASLGDEIKPSFRHKHSHCFHWSLLPLGVWGALLPTWQVAKWLCYLEQALTRALMLVRMQQAYSLSPLLVHLKRFSYPWISPDGGCIQFMDRKRAFYS